MDYTGLVEAFLRRRDERRLQRLEAELWKFAEALDTWLHELLAHPRADWREQLAAFFAEQEAEGRIALPESRQSIIDYLGVSAASIGLEPGSEQSTKPVETHLVAQQTPAASPQDESAHEPPSRQYPETFGEHAAILEEEFRRQSLIEGPPLMPEVAPLRDHAPRIVEIKQVKGIWAHYDDLVASGKYDPNWLKRAFVGFARQILPSSEPSTRITFDDGTVLILLGGGPDSGALGGQAAMLPGFGGALAGATTARQAAISAFKHLGRETAEAVADNVFQEVSGLPVGPNALRRSKSTGKAKSRKATPATVPRNLGRPYLRKATRKKIEEAAEKTPDGKFISATNKKVIEGEFHYGHIQGREHRRLVAQAEDREMTQQEFNDWVNSHPEWFQIEDPESNLSHRFEKPGND